LSDAPTDTERRPIRSIPAPGAPPPGHPGAIIWARGDRETAAVAASPLDDLIGALFLLLWRMLGLLALPVLLLHPRARRHIVAVPAPVPGWTWLHGASAGEHVAARALARCLDGRVWRTSSSWRTPVVGAFPAPLDLPWVFEGWLDRARPRRLVLVEAELWPGWLAACHARGIPVVVVNARQGRGTHRWRQHPRLWRWLTRGVSFLDQAETGDLKLSTELQAATMELGRDTIIAASTRPGDEERVLAGWLLLPLPRPLLILAPRHLDRVPALVAMLSRLEAEQGITWSQRSRVVDPSRDVLLLDTLGELATLYQQARAAFVGGTFDPAIGGHSPAEAFAAGLPVLHGPHTASNPVAWSQGIALRLPDDCDASTFSKALRSAMAVGPKPVGVNEAAARCAALLPEGKTPDESAARPWLAPVVPIVQAIGRRSRGYGGEVQRVDVPVLSVGALVAGGAGKTPAVGWLAAQLPGAWVVARGYRRGGGGGDVRVGLPGEEPARPLGDELEMLRRRGVSVVSAPDRVAGAQEAARRGARLVILDDGFQHRRLHRDLDLVCIDGRWPAGRGPLPVGSSREPWSALSRAHHLWLSHPDADADLTLPLPTVQARYRARHFLHRGKVLPLRAVKGPLHVVAGIAHPSALACTLIEAGFEIAGLQALPDHGALPALPAGAVVSEKDAARLRPDADVYALVLELELRDEAALLQAARALMEGR
jgi:tetraacyldisaccharide 4'-kinase